MTTRLPGCGPGPATAVLGQGPATRMGAGMGSAQPRQMRLAYLFDRLSIRTTWQAMQMRLGVEHPRGTHFLRLNLRHNPVRLSLIHTLMPWPRFKA